MKFIEMFAGIGGMGYGLMQAGMQCVGYAEIDKFAREAYRILHDEREEMWNATDVRGVTDDDLRNVGRERGPIQIIVAGFPCQSFSYGYDRSGFKDTTRGTLFFEVARYASILKPEWLLLENVTGLLTHDNGKTFATILCTLDELGYDAEWHLYNSVSHVPQNRERVYIIGHTRGKSKQKIFPIQKRYNHFIKYNKKENIDEIPATVEKKEGKKSIAIIHMNKKNANCICTREYKGIARGTNIIIKGNTVRRLTPLECFRLQSFPDEWYYKLKENNISDTQLYKMAGNAVTSVVSYEIAKSIWEVEHGQVET